MASGSCDNTLLVMNLDTGSRVRLIEEDHQEYQYHASIALSPDGNLLGSACGKKVRWLWVSFWKFKK